MGRTLLVYWDGTGRRGRRDLSYASWDALGGPELLDCRAHHDDWNLRGGEPRARWHDESPPIQSTWGPLIRALLAFQGNSYIDENVRAYQRDRWGMAGNETAILQLSALHAKSMSVKVERTLHRAERINVLCARLKEYAPAFSVFYGTTYAGQYAKIAGEFNAEGWCWNGNTLCVLTQHPAYRYAPGTAYWTALGDWMRMAVDAGPNFPIYGCPQPFAQENDKVSVRNNAASVPSTAVDRDVVAIQRHGADVGRVSYDGWHVSVEERIDSGTYRVLGFYENTRPNQFARKICEIEDIFDNWRALPISGGYAVKANWRRAQFVPDFAPPPNAITIGCTVLEEDGVPVALIYKIRPCSAVLVPL